MSDIHADHSQTLKEGDPERGRLAKKKQDAKPPSMEQRRKSVAKKLMRSPKLPDTYEEYEAMENKPPLRGDVEGGIDLEKVKPVYFKSREQATKDAANLAMREKDQKERLDKYLSISSSIGREGSHYLFEDEHLGGELMGDSPRDFDTLNETLKTSAGALKDEAAIAATGALLDKAGTSKAFKALEETAFDRGLKTFQDYGKASKDLMGDEERWLRQAEKAARKQLKKLGYENKMIDRLLKQDLSDESSEVLKIIKKSKALQKWAATKTSMAAKDELMKAAGKTAARKAAAREAAEKLTKTVFKTIGNNGLRHMAKLAPGVGLVYDFLEHATSVVTRSKELPNQLAQNARAMKRPLQRRDVESSVLVQLKENADLREDLYSRGVISAKLYDSLTESEESAFEGE